ncbi:hypothetical protein TrST_g3639 [Triparma strigata]|uniref:Uncharacterized protein n=1 Tax=Triparma strigata TaxID=1606541 RepID=A0A9W7E6H1_9STRA|nr:hypothetical protein TrST_g3639 [Triparma strigata]
MPTSPPNNKSQTHTSSQLSNSHDFNFSVQPSLNFSRMASTASSQRLNSRTSTAASKTRKKLGNSNKGPSKASARPSTTTGVNARRLNLKSGATKKVFTSSMSRESLESKKLNSYGSFDFDLHAINSRFNAPQTPASEFETGYVPNFDLTSEISNSTQRKTAFASLVASTGEPPDTYKYTAAQTENPMKRTTPPPTTLHPDAALSKAEVDDLMNSAVKRPGGNFQFLARTQRSSEFPTMRQQISELEAEWVRAMSVLSSETTINPTNPLESDLNGIEGAVDREFKVRMAMWAAVEAGKIYDSRERDEERKRRELTEEGIVPEPEKQESLGSLGLTDSLMPPTEEDALPAADSDGDDESLDKFDPSASVSSSKASIRPKSANLTFRKNSSAPPTTLIPPTLSAFLTSCCSLTSQKTAHSREILAKSIYEHKWCDLICDNLASQVGTACMEHGRLLRDLRQRYANSFQAASRLHSDALWQLDSVIAGLIRCWRRLEEAEGLWLEHEIKLREEADGRIAAIQKLADVEYQETVKVRSNATKEVERISNTLKTLNGIFKDMQNDKINITMNDLNSTVVSQNKEVRNLTEKNKEIKTAKDELLRERIKTALANKEIEQLKAQVEEQAAQLAKKDAEIESLTEEEYQRRVEVEKLKAKLEANDDTSDEEDNTAANGGTGGVGVKSTMYMARITEKGEVIWKQPMGDIENVAEEFDRAKPNHRLLCHSYRLMLPNIGAGNRPPRNLFWVRRCMRAILHSKTMDDSSLSNREESKTRFPELVYSWFEPDSGFIKKISDEEELKDIYSRANADRWGLYYGVKHLSVDDAEAHLFFTFLDEAKGEDYITFFLFCMQCVEGIRGELLRKQFGICQHGIGGYCTSFTRLQEQVFAENLLLSSPTEDCDGDFYGCGGAQVIWVPLHVAEKACEICLAASTPEIIQGAIETTRDLSVDTTDRVAPEDAESYCVPQFENLEEASIITDESSLDSIGEAKKKEVEVAEHLKPKCVNFFLWLRHMMDVYEKEAAHRRAAVRLMFETANTGALTSDVPHGGDESGSIAMAAHADEEKYIDLPQFLAIARTVYPYISTSEAAAIFRESYNVIFPPTKHHKPPPPGINFSAFLQAAENRQLFSKSLMVPMFLGAEQTNQLDDDVAQRLRSLIHMHSEQLHPTVAEIKEGLPERAQAKVDALLGEISSGLFDEFAVAGGGNKVMRPFAAYRRLLSFLLHLRFVRHEKGDGFILKGHGEEFDVSKSKRSLSVDQSVNVIEKLGGKELVNKLLDPNDHSTYKTIGNEVIKILDQRKVMAQSQNELDYLREIIMDFRPNRRIQALKLIMEGTACVRLQRCWHRKMDKEVGPPLSLRKLMRTGYIRGEGMVRTRRVNRTIGWTQGMVAELFSTYIHVMHHSSKMCQNPPSLATVVYRFFLCRWGCVSLAERDLHDLYLNVRNVAQRVPRCRLFAAFTNCSLRGSATDRAMCEDFGTDVEAMHFYLRSILMVHSVHDKVAKAQAKKLNNAYNPSKFFLLFPTTQKDARGMHKWLVPSVVVTQCTKQLFQAIYDRGDDADGKKSYMKLLHQIEDLATGGERLVDVDEWSWIVLCHWAGIKSRRKGIAYGHGDEVKHREESRHAFSSMTKLRSKSVEVCVGSKEEDDGGEVVVQEEGKPPRRVSMRQQMIKRDSRIVVPAGEKEEGTDDHHAHRQELFTDTKMYQEVLEVTRTERLRPAEAVSRSVHKHMMGDINLPLPLDKLPATDGEQLGRQLLTAWAGFKRPMKFLMEELKDHEEGDDEVKEVEEATAELEYFEELVKKLDEMISGGGGGGVGVTPPEGSDGGDEGAAHTPSKDASQGVTRPSTSSGDTRKGMLLDLGVKTWALLRHLCDKVKQVYVHEAVHTQPELIGTSKDPLVCLDHPLKDNWSVGRRPSLGG